MKKEEFKLNYFVIPLIAIIILLLGKHFTSVGMNWYLNKLILPAITPPKWVFPIAWQIIYLLATVGTIYIWNNYKEEKNFFFLIFFIALNAFLNVLWSLLFFYNQMIFFALLDVILINIVTTIIFTQLLKKSFWGCSVFFTPFNMGNLRSNFKFFDLDNKLKKYLKII